MRWALLAVAAQRSLTFTLATDFSTRTEDPAEVPGGFLSDLNPVGSWGMG